MASSSNSRKVLVTVSVLVASVLATFWLTGLGSYLRFFSSSWTSPAGKMTATPHRPSSLANWALQKVLEDARPVFGPYDNAQSDASTWMSRYPDNTRLVRMNIPGAHDAATWNYSAATQRALKPVTDLLSDAASDPDWFRCQDRSIVDMLNAGVRAFDLRYAQDVTKTTLVFWHGSALQSQTATLDDVLHGFYWWLDDHPSETVLLSLKYEDSAAMKNFDDESVQRQLYDILTSGVATQYILPRRGVCGTLGSARGKIVLLRRFDLNRLSPSHENSIPGIHLSPQDWSVNSPAMSIVYNDSPDATAGEEGVAHIEDFYHPTSPSLAEDIDLKFDAVQRHLQKAASDSHPDGLFWTFTSATDVKDDPESATPRKVALGDGAATDVQGVNHRLRGMLREMRGKRLGIVMLDFFEQPEGLLRELLDLTPP